MSGAAGTGRHPLQRGFSLLEVMVAFVIMAMSLALLYRAMGGSADAVARVTQQQRAALLAQSLLDSRDYVGPGGWNESGESAGMQWRASSHLFPSGEAAPPAVPLHEVRIDISWSHNGSAGSWSLVTLLPQRRPLPAEVG